MNKTENELSRVERKNKRNRSDWLLNGSIAVVVLLIIVTVVIIFNGDDEVQKVQENKNSLIDEEKVVVKDESEVKKQDQLEKDATLKVDNQETDNEAMDKAEEPGTFTHMLSDDKVVAETIVNTAWEPIATKQTGEHVSSYNGNSVDFNEKKEAIAYATGKSTDSLIFWKVNNGGGPKKSIGIVSTYDKSEKYRVFIEWIEQEGWKPVQVDVLNTLDIN